MAHRLDISAWFDEAFSYGMSTQGWHSFFTVWVWGSESNMLLYYLLLRGWLGFLALIGVAPNAMLLRLPSAVFAVGAALAVYALGRYLFGRIAGIIAGGLFLANFLVMILAQTARAYSLGLFLICLSWLALLVALKRNTARWWAFYVIASLLAVYALLFSGLVIVSQVLAVGLLLILPGAWRALARNAVRRYAVSTVLTFIGVLPIGLDAVLHGGPVWVPPAGLGDLRLLVHTVAGDSRAYEYLVLAIAGLGVLLAVASNLPRFSTLPWVSPVKLGPATALASWLAVPILISFALTQPSLNLHLFYPRYLVVVVPPLCLLAGLGVQALPTRAAQAALAVALLLVAWPPLLHYYENSQVQDFKDPVAWMQERYQPGDGIVCDPVIECGIPVAYYLQVEPGPAHLDPNTPGRFLWELNSTVPISADVIRAYAGGHHRIFFIYGPLGPSQAMDAEAASLEATLTADGYRLVDHIESVGSSVKTEGFLYES